MSEQLEKRVKRHKKLYFEDGDIVLAAPSPTAPDILILFRVDKILLARHSPIFRDMLSFSAGSGPDDTYDGVPRVNLTDNGDDLAMLLSGMYNAA